MTAEPAASSTGPVADEPLSGTLHVHVALDWGDEVDLAQARQLVPGEWLTLARRSRTPSSITYRPTPLRCQLAPVALELPELGVVEASADATVFDFAAVSLALHLPFRLRPSEISRLAGELSAPESIVAAAVKAAGPLNQRLLPAIEQPNWSELSEEYFVFHFDPDQPGVQPSRLLGEQSAWAAGLVRLEDQPLSTDEVAEALRLRISYTPQDVFVPEWSAALLVDRDCDETLQTIAFANLQLLEFRHIDNRLDDRLARAYRFIRPLSNRWLPFWRRPGRQLRELGELRMEVHDVYERTGNVLKLVGDPYLARVYHLLTTRFHLQEWRQNIQEALEVAENAYQVISDQSAVTRTETLEWIVIMLIAFEVAMALVRPK
ncbi:MAG TPA: hypothetical protein VHV55_19460 [Pirellulales bacterium]|jgi:hypothetical protein|nr:hypothetical protein [Pirellulales bacterium]